jgi:hypothetical protein
MRAEPFAGGYAIFVNHPQWPELDVLGVEVIGKGKAVIGIEPTMVGVTSLVTASKGVHLISCCDQ